MRCLLRSAKRPNGRPPNRAAERRSASPTFRSRDYRADSDKKQGRRPDRLAMTGTGSLSPARLPEPGGSQRPAPEAGCGGVGASLDSRAATAAGHPDEERNAPKHVPTGGTPVSGCAGKRCLAGRAGRRKVTVHKALFRREGKDADARRLAMSRKERHGFVSAPCGSFRAWHGPRAGPASSNSSGVHPFGSILRSDVQHGQHPPFSVPGVPV